MRSYNKVKHLPFNGVAEQILWEVAPAIAYTTGPDYDVKQLTSYVVTSATVVFFSGPETYIFPADKDGEVLGWMELPGSFRGAFDHERAIANVGSYCDD